MIDIINHEEGIAMAVETLSNITQDEVEYARMCNLIKSQLDYQSGMVDARRSGIKEGREEEKLIIAKNLLSKGSTPEFVHEITGLSLENIAQL